MLPCMDQDTFTQKRDAASASSEHQDKPVWLRLSQATRLFGIGRSLLYELIAEEKIRSRVFKRRRDSQRGIRLVSYDSLAELIEKEGS